MWGIPTFSRVFSLSSPESASWIFDRGDLEPLSEFICSSTLLRRKLTSGENLVDLLRSVLGFCFSSELYDELTDGIT